uniref:Uncharacterized protein n=1 Tax=Anguilla anguilla TaxID=7936 RepID=A0A0E9VL59_ANGAN
MGLRSGMSAGQSNSFTLFSTKPFQHCVCWGNVMKQERAFPKLLEKQRIV